MAGYAPWVTGIRREQSAMRAQSQQLEWDNEYRLYKISPLLDWTREHVWYYICVRQLPYSPLHDRQYASIGCVPCTRPGAEGEHERAGRWWWEQAEGRECGLHPRARN
jgi:phosphoadenosine phosphosulfate reductase